MSSVSFCTPQELICARADRHLLGRIEWFRGGLGIGGTIEALLVGIEYHLHGRDRS